MIIGLTGGIGSGKSTIGSFFRLYNVPVYVADIEAKKLLDTNKSIQYKLEALIGADIRSSQGINRAVLANHIFADSALREKVNAIIHPAVTQHFNEWYHRQEAPYVLREAAILFESGSYKDCFKIIVVHAERELRIERVMKRSTLKRREVIGRMQSQWTQEEKMKRAHYLIANEKQIPDLKELEDHWYQHGSLPESISPEAETVVARIKEIHEDIIRCANQRS